MSNHIILPMLEYVANITEPDFPYEYHVISTVSKVSGAFSLLIWLFAQLPQVLENHLNHSVQGVSVAFLSSWILGDVTNLFGCLLTRALPFQTSLASYYCFIDFILGLQYWYYTKVYPKQKVHHNFLQSPNMMRPVNSRSSSHGTSHLRRNRFEATPKQDMVLSRSISSGTKRIKTRKSFLLKIISGSVLSASFGKANAMPFRKEDATVNFQDTLRALFSCIVSFAYSAKAAMPHFHYNPTLIGTICGYTSSVLYVSSRAPQILKNYKSKSTKGVSYLLFLFAMIGNTLYTTSILSDLYLLSRYDRYMGEVSFNSVFYAQLPFVIGSAGTVLFDCVLLFQCWYYDTSKAARDIFSHPIHDSNAHNPSHSAEPSNHGYLSYYPNGRPVRNNSSNFATHFTEPDWYTNVHRPQVGELDVFYDMDSDSNNDGTESLTQKYNSSRGFQALYSQNSYQRPLLPYYPPTFLQTHDHSNQDAVYTETSLLLRLALIIPPPPNYVSSASTTGMNSLKHKKGISGTFNAIARSFSQSSSMVRSPVMSSSLSNSIAASPIVGTSLLPSIVGTYSSVSKRMMNDSKIPFLPSDFLHPDFGKSSTGLGFDN